jgi:hypothetical protein
MERWAATIEAMARDKATKEIMFGKRRLEISGSDKVLFFRLTPCFIYHTPAEFGINSIHVLRMVI